MIQNDEDDNIGNHDVILRLTQTKNKKNVEKTVKEKKKKEEEEGEKEGEEKEEE